MGKVIRGTASGKTTFTEKLKNQLGDIVTPFSSDDFYKGLPPNTNPDDYDFDHPNSLDFDHMFACLQKLSKGEEASIPSYCFKTHAKIPGGERLIKPNKILVFEGILSLHDDRIRSLMDLKIFIVCDEDLALARRIKRDISERGRDVKEVLSRYMRFIKQSFQQFVKPQMKQADLIVPGGANNDS